jgi:hypothetical protein
MKIKKFLIAGILILMSSNIFGQLKPKIALSYEFNGCMTMTQNQTIVSTTGNIKNTTYINNVVNYKVPQIIIKSGLEYQYKHLSGYFDNTIYSTMISPEPGKFSPKQITFVIGVKYNITKNIVFSAEHMCSHTISPNLEKLPDTYLNASYDKITLSYGY